MAVGAHPGFPDLVGFGRRELKATPREVEDLVLYQIGALAAIAASEGVPVSHVKAHGALYNMAARDRSLADAIARGAAAFDSRVILFGLPNSELLRAGEAAGLRVASEGFADRAYMADGSLAPRTAAGSVITDPEIVLQRALRMVTRGEATATDGSTLTFAVDTLCVHGDTPGAAELTRRLREGLEQRGVAVRAFMPPASAEHRPPAGPPPGRDDVGPSCSLSCDRPPRLLRVVARWHTGCEARARRRRARVDARCVRRDAHALLLTSIIADLSITRQTAGAIGSVTLLAAAAGGLFFGVVADRYGRTRALMASVIIYSVFTAACGFATTALQLAVFRILLGIGMGGEWASGAALVSETWPAEHRGKALGLMQSAWAIGYLLAAAVTMIVLPRWGWRVVFFMGVLPAFLTFWVRRHVREPELWLTTRGSTRPRGRLGDVFRNGRAGVTIAVTTMNACTLFAWWGFNLWLPGFLSMPAASGGIGLSATVMSWFVIAMQVGMWFGYITFGYISDAIGRKRAMLPTW